MGEPTQLDAGHRIDFALAGNRRGQAVVAWVKEDPSGWSKIVARFGRCGRFGPPISLARGKLLGSPRIDLNERGDALFAWESGPLFERDVAARIRWADGSLGAPEHLGPLGESDGLEVTAASIGQTGKAAVVFTPYTSDPEANYPTGLFAALRPPRGRFARAQRLGLPGKDLNVLGLSDAQARVTPRGAVVVAWTHLGTRSDFSRVAVANKGRFGPAHRLSRGPDEARLADLALGPRGEATVLWLTDSVEEQAFRPRLLVGATRPEGGRFGPAERVVNEAAPLEIQGATLAYDPVRRSPVALWAVERCTRLRERCGPAAIHTARRR